MPQPILIVDAFTDRPFGGNPAAVCVLPEARDESWMQKLAMEMNLSETAFTHPEPGTDALRLRWFTPEVEVELCGHATLATAHALWSEGQLPADVPARFVTLSGPLKAERRDGWITLDFPATPITPDRPVDVPGLDEILGAAVKSAGYSKFDLLVELESEQAVRLLCPNIAKLGQIPVRGVIATAKATSPGFDFVSRFFAPQVGVAEDPVCGSAHCCLGPYWGAKLGKTDLMAYQASARGGVLRVGFRDDRVTLGGQAVTVMRGELP